MFKLQLKETVLIFVFFCLVVASGIDLAQDYSEGSDFSHVSQEAVILTLSLVTLAWLVVNLRRHLAEIKKLRDELISTKETSPVPKRYVLEAKASLRHVITKQFDDWLLTDSEKEVGWFLLKGFSLKEISTLRETREKTVRQQASSIYKKTGLSGRHSFSAWFIEDAL